MDIYQHTRLTGLEWHVLLTEGWRLKLWPRFRLLPTTPDMAPKVLYFDYLVQKAQDFALNRFGLDEIFEISPRLGPTSGHISLS